MYGGRISRNIEKRTGAASADSGAECIFQADTAHCHFPKDKE